MKPGSKVLKPGSSKNSTISVNWLALKSLPFILAFFGLLAGVILAYRDHYNNPFHFDDDHTIVKNHWVRELDSFPRFFVDSTTSSSLPRNQAYRPGVTLLHAIDYRLSIDTTSAEAKASLDSAQNVYQRRAKIERMLAPTTHTFHVHIFIGFVLSGILLFLVLLYIFTQALPEGKWNHWLALFGMGWFWLHTANAETINYISARSDSASTFWILAAFVVYFYWNAGRKFMLYLIPMAIGFFIKEPAIMFAPLILIFISLFGKEEKPIVANLLPLGMTFLVALVLFSISRHFTPTSWDAGGTDPWHYLLTEAFVVFHYCYNFILPVNLSADTDWKPVTSVFDDKVFAGALFIGLLVYIMIRCWKKREWRPVSFGIAWFFIALAPTTSIFPFAEVLNDHRTYFPYIGLIMAVTWTAGMWLKNVLDGKSMLKATIIGFAGLVLVANGFGAYERCRVWSSSESLWGDCIHKSPGNGRAWMHYGMSMFARGNANEIAGRKDSANYWYDSADVCYDRAQLLQPYYSYLFINRGVLRQWQGRNDEAEQFYRKALSYDSGNPEAYYYLGDFLRLRGRTDEAYKVASDGLALSPDHVFLNRLFAQVAGSNPYQQVAQYEAAVKAKPSVDDYINLSLAYYNAHAYDECVTAAQEALKLDSNSVIALNNICSAQNMLGNYDAAIIAGRNALIKNGGFAQARGNLAEALRCKAVMDSLTKNQPKNPGSDYWVNLSVSYYNAKMYAQTIRAAENALAINPKDFNAWNNICVACNRLEWYDRAVEAGQKALAIKPDFVLAKNNLDEALIGQQAERKMRQASGKP
jgi:tetratricopeptide (TPR) repeat protein